MLHDYPAMFPGRALWGATVEVVPTSLPDAKEPKQPLIYLYAHLGPLGKLMSAETSHLAVILYGWEWTLQKLKMDKEQRTQGQSPLTGYEDWGEVEKWIEEREPGWIKRNHGGQDDSDNQPGKRKAEDETPAPESNKKQDTGTMKCPIISESSGTGIARIMTKKRAQGD